MVWRKITIDNSVKYVPKTEKNKKQSEKIQSVSRGSKQNRNKKFLKNLAASGFGKLTK